MALLGITITIGRNIKGTTTPLSDEEWSAFTARLSTEVWGTLDALHRDRILSKEQLDKTFVGTTSTPAGQWRGSTEDAYSLSASVDVSLVHFAVGVFEARVSLSRRLKVLMEDFQQEAIYLLVGEASLLGAK